ncbi:hypothetical protein HRM2_19010 [Desulforapulum autotrophicum HRM2]|uniref:Uncharacterized protein n=1 Tax=Desulforapulum autotrophicum (strain ATCC 43914 / DSM 3382 / VKM B-1955 / HRM2) TaxID=177437 RepID=C0QBZ0_DESAH|nr:hypothetical protein HRM2_19010 [Desulforapulum autotrophicum HRM2]
MVSVPTTTKFETSPPVMPGWEFHIKLLAIIRMNLKKVNTKGKTSYKQPQSAGCNFPFSIIYVTCYGYY